MIAHDFSLPDQDGVMHTLKQYKQQWIVLYFYPKDDTPGCTKEACSFRDAIQQFQDHNIVMLGVSKDSIASHKKFAEKYHLNFPLLSDESKEIIQAYGAWGEKKFMGRTYEGIYRKTYFIGPNSEIKKVYDKVNPLLHANEILKDMRILNPASKKV